MIRSRFSVPTLALALVLLQASAASALRVEILTVFSADPNDPFAQEVSLIKVQVGDDSAITGDDAEDNHCIGGKNNRRTCSTAAECPGGSCANPGDNDGDGVDDGFGIARIEIPPGFQSITIPIEELKDFDGNKYQVGSVFVTPESTGVTTECSPNGTVGNVGFAFEDISNAEDQVDYKIAIRIVPLGAPAFTGGQQCLAGDSGTKRAATCQLAINKSSAAYFNARLKALAHCHKLKLAGKLPIVDCRSEEKTSAAIGKAQEKLQTAIDNACGGPDKTCATPDDVPIAGLGFGSVCPDLSGFGCTNPIASCGDVAACLLCINSVAADQTMAILGHAGFSDAKTQKALNKCQQTIVAAGVGYLTSVSGIYTKCADADLKKKSNPNCINGPNGTRVGNLEGKLLNAIEQNCESPDAGRNFTPGEIGFGGVTCPRVHEPSSHVLESSCFDNSFTHGDIAHCVDCISLFHAECAAYAASPGAHQFPYPHECAAVIVP